MPAQTNLNVSPYYDDFDSNKNYYRVLYKAGFPIQARELTQSQTILQDQLEMFSSRFFKDGDNLVPGEFGLANPADYVRLSAITQGSRIEEFIGYQVRGASSGVIAKITHGIPADEDDDITIYVNYETSGNDYNQKTFQEGEILETDHPNNYTAVVGVTNISKPTTSPAVGQGTFFAVSGGNYYVNGFSVRNEAQVIALDKYGTTPTYEVGFTVLESFVTSNDDPSLNDNSQGSANFAAPGADRLKIELVLTKRAWGDVDSNFILLATIQNGNILGKPDQTIKWKWLYDILAKRTYDESGNYIVRDFPVEPLEYWNDVEVDGVWDKDELTGLYPPLPGSGSDINLDFDEADSNYVVRVDPGLAYVHGYEVGLKHPLFVYGKKPRTTEYTQNSLTQITPGYNIEITNVYGSPDVENLSGSLQTRAFDNIVTFRNFNDGHTGQSSDSNGRPMNRGNAPWKTYHIIFIRGVESAPDCVLKGDGGVVENIPMAFDNMSGIDLIAQPDGICPTPTSSVVFNNEDQSYLNLNTPYASSTTYEEIYVRGNSMVVASTVPIRRGDDVNGNKVLISIPVNPVPSGVIKTRYLKPTDRNIDDSLFGYNSSYKLGVLTSTYFTELRVIGVINPNDWVEGEPVYGEESGAIGIVEPGSTDNVLLLSNIIGAFMPGEEITQNNKVSRILRDGEITDFHFYDLGTSGNVFDLSNEDSVTLFAVGSKITLTVADGEIEAFPDRIEVTPIGTDKLRGFPYPEGSSTNTRVATEVRTSPGNVNGYAVQLDYKITNSLSKTKSFYSAQADINDFSADISVQNKKTTEIIDVASGSLFSGRRTYNFVTCDNLGGDPTDELVAGDLVTFVDDLGETINRLVLFCTRSIGYGSFRSPSRIYFSQTLPNSVSGKTMQRVRCKSDGKPNETLLYQLPNSTVKSLESDNLKTGIDYQVMKEFVVSVSSGATQFTISTTKTNETFVPDPNLYSVTVAVDQSNPSSDLEGRQIKSTQMVFDRDGGRKVIIGLDFGATGIPSHAILKVHAPIEVSDAYAKRKIAVRETLNIPKLDAERRVISLKHADVYAVQNLGYFDVNGEFIDIFENYILDNGQRDNYYDISRLILKEGKPIPSTELVCTFYYFAHDNQGDFFSVDSYTHDGGVDYSAIPYFLPFTNSIKSSDNANVIQLRDCVDFRPIVNTTGANPSVIASIEQFVPYSPTLTFPAGSTNFIDSSDDGNAFVPRMPVPGSQFKCDIEYYLPKIDSLFLDKSGEFKIVRGLPASAPIPPEDISTGIRLYDISLPAYTFSIKNTKIRKFNYRVFRMKDIADINRRVERSEELITLTLLELAAINMSVRDAVTGLDRYKNGIVVDAFRDHSKGDVNSTQYRNSIDPEHTHLRAPHFDDQIELEDILQTDEAMQARGYSSKDDIITCDYEEVEYQKNEFATKGIRLSPYSQSAYTGKIYLTPQVDTWKDTSRAPFLVIDEDEVYNAIQGTKQQSRFNKEFSINTVWGDWETTSSLSSTNSQQNGRRGHNIVRSEHQKREADFVFENVKAKQGGSAVQLYNDNQNWSSSINVSGGITGYNKLRESSDSVIKSATSMVIDTSLGDRVADVALQSTMRTREVRFRADNLKPKTEYHAFFDGVNVDAWVSPDAIDDQYPDQKFRFHDYPGHKNVGFGERLVSDETGALSGIFLVPNGRSPVPGREFITLPEVVYMTTGPTRSFPQGSREFSLQTETTFSENLKALPAHASGTYTASPVINDKQEYIISTRVAEDVSGESEFDPLAQTFMVDKGVNAEGVFITSLDLFFEKKDPNIGVEFYMVSTDGQVPTNNVIPGTRVFKQPDTLLRVICELSPLSSNTATLIDAGTVVVGQTSGARGVVKATTTFEPASSNPVQNVNNYVYNLVIENFVGDFIPGEVLFPLTSPLNINSFRVAEDEIFVTRIDLRALGANYATGDTVEFSAPELPGGTTATARLVVDQSSRIADVVLTDPGSGYTNIPSATIVTSTGGDAVLSVRGHKGRKGVVMGVATSEDANAPTRFTFNHPVFLMADISYAIVVKAGATTKYRIYASKIGEKNVKTDTKVIDGHGTGPLYLSKNLGFMEPETNMALKYTINRAKFETNVVSNVTLQNVPLYYDELPRDPIETNSSGNSGNDPVFGLNPTIIKVTHTMHGLNVGDIVHIQGIMGNPGGIPDNDINRIHTVIASEIDYFMVQTDNPANTSSRSGGIFGQITSNRPYEVICVTGGGMNFASSLMEMSVKSTQSSTTSGYNLGLAYRPDIRRQIMPDRSFYFDGPRQVSSYLDEAYFNQSRLLNGKRSLELFLSLRTDNDFVSPVFDLQRINATLVRNVINNPNPEDQVFGPKTKTFTTYHRNIHVDVEPGDNVSFTRDEVDYNATIVSVNKVTGKIAMMSENLDKDTTFSQFSDTTLAAQTLDRFSETNRKYFNDETTNFGSSYSKWLSRLFVFENPCDGLQVKLSCVFYDTKDIRVYYRPRAIGFDGDVSQINWIPFNTDGSPDNVDRIEARSSQSVDPDMIKSSEYQSVTWSVQDTAKFDAVAVKIVMTADNPAKAPLIDDMQLVATE